MKNLLSDIVKSLVDNEDAVVIKEVQGEQTDIFEVSVDKEDVGKIIGKQGRTAQSIRTLMRAISKKKGKSYILNIL
jgi:predicted RNA-binding protein YlqC (UPF0109 family)